MFVTKKDLLLRYRTALQVASVTKPVEDIQIQLVRCTQHFQLSINSQFSIFNIGSGQAFSIGSPDSPEQRSQC
jgi:hypothetical protein